MKFHIHPLPHLTLVAVVAMVLAGCASKPLGSFEDGRPVLRPEAFFAGHTHSWGVFETTTGQPKEIFHTVTQGYWDGDQLHFEQDITFEQGKKMHRSWLIQRQDARHYSATGTGIVGTAHGEVSGNVFHLDFTLDAKPGNPLAHVHMSQWMYLQSDGRTMVNRDTITKGGLILTEVTEQFWKDH